LEKRKSMIATNSESQDSQRGATNESEF
jgi:hypothetical protein